MPAPWKLVQMGHGALYKYIRRYRDLFRYIVYDDTLNVEKIGGKTLTYNIATRNEHITTLQRLMINGDIPVHGWLIENGYTRLASYLKRYPDLIKQQTSQGLLNKPKCKPSWKRKK